jgi:hypothetical protein
MQASSIKAGGRTHHELRWDPNYLVGRANAAEYRNFFSFDVSSINRRVILAELQVNSGAVKGDLTETLSLFDVSTSGDVVNNNGEPDVEIFRDLGTGISYGTL